MRRYSSLVLRAPTAYHSTHVSWLVRSTSVEHCFEPQHTPGAALQVTKLAVPDEGLFYLYTPDPDWRNEADCGTAQYTRADGSTLPLNCAGPKHAYFR